MAHNRPYHCIDALLTTVTDSVDKTAWKSSYQPVLEITMPTAHNNNRLSEEKHGIISSLLSIEVSFVYIIRSGQYHNWYAQYIWRVSDYDLVKNDVCMLLEPPNTDGTIY